MTKYVLHGGNTGELNSDNNAFFAEMTADLPGKIKFLLNYFAREDGEVEKCAKDDKKRLLDNSGNKDIEFQITDPTKIAEQIRWCDVMYMRGGETKKLLDQMKKVSNLESLFQNKVITGSSAGVYILVKYYRGNISNRLDEGLGILNLKSFCHYSPDEGKNLQELIEYGDKNLPVLTLPNFKMAVLYK